MSVDRKAKQELQSKVLDTVTATCVTGLFYWKPDLFNPWHLTLWQWLVGGILIRSAIAFYDHLVVFVVDRILCDGNNSNSPSTHHLLPTRRNPNQPVRYVSLDRKSTIFLFLNAIHEWIFVQRLCHYIWYSPNVPLEMDRIGLVNTLGALGVMFIMLDFFYAPCHHILHMPWLYPLIHKHHHRQHFPTRGYLDAGNEHPVEHFVGCGSIWGAVWTAVHLVGAHGIALFVFFNMHAALAMLNHSPYHVQIPLIPGMIQYRVAHHEMHHRKFTINYAQYCMWYDHLMHTFAPYDEGPSSSSIRSSIRTKEL